MKECFLVLGLSTVLALFSYAKYKSSTAFSKRVGVGIAVVLLSADKKQVLMGIRKNSHGEGTLAFSGGWLEVGESFEDCALRELSEETGLLPNVDVNSQVSVMNVAPSNNIFPTVHSVTVFVLVLALETCRAPRVVEPLKCKSWEWMSVEKLRGNNDLNMFPSARALLANPAFHNVLL